MVVFEPERLTVNVLHGRRYVCSSFITACKFLPEGELLKGMREVQSVIIKDLSTDKT